MKGAFWKTDWFLGLAITIAFVVASGSAFMFGIESSVYDFGVRASSGDPGSDVAVIAIDDESIGNIGRWPWSREIHAQMVDMLAQGGAKTIGLTVFYSEPQIDQGLQWIRQLSADFERGQFSAGGNAAQAFGDKLAEAETALDTDTLLAATIESADNVILPMQFIPGQVIGNPDEELPDYVTRFALGAVDDNNSYPLTTIDAAQPIAALGTPAYGIGHLLNLLEDDGGVRVEPLVISYYDKYYPSQALLLAASKHNLSTDGIEVSADGVQLGGLKIRTDPSLTMRTFFYSDKDGRPAFPVDSFFDVYSGDIPVDKYKDKIVLIGPTAFGLGTSMVTPVSETMAPVLIMAHNVASILNEDFFISPGWAGYAEVGVFLLIALYLIIVLPKLKAGMAAIMSAVLLLGLLGVEVGLMTTQGMWLQLATAATMLFVGHLLLTTKRFLVTEAGKIKSDTAGAQSSRMLGLANQQQGQLDMAFENFRKCPLDDEIMDPLYNLALDYERKRQFNKANSVYQYMADYDPKFRDLETRMTRAKAMEETVLLGGGGSGPTSTMLLDDGGMSKPMLGRYEIDKELGKGAMGVVYLGKDPKINRVVAIKTMALAQEFEADELDEVKSRFFREAETAGRLQHPNIVTIYDAGEEHDLAYIAMEFLEGHDLAKYTKPDSLLPLPLVMGIIFKSAMALDYAHKQHVVHRDIKPANIMYEPNKKQVKLTDFGIARITDSSKTKTGMVLGTPSYMSPEQLSGKKVDGRSDLFSLGVMLYQMVSGKLPFKGDSMATLMYQIANEPHPELFQARPDLAKTKPCLAAIIDKALQKDVEQRYQNGAEMAKDLQQCAKQPAAA